MSTANPEPPVQEDQEIYLLEQVLEPFEDHEKPHPFLTKKEQLQLSMIHSYVGIIAARLRLARR